MKTHAFPAGLRTRWRALSPVTRFLAGFVAGLAVLAVVYPWLSARFHGQALWLMEATARVVAVFASPFLDFLLRDGRVIHTRGVSVEVIEECTGVYEILIFWAAVAAYPATHTAKATGLIGGAVALLAINIVRMTGLVVIGRYRPDVFDFLHTYFWQATLILMILTVWLLWIRLFTGRAPGDR